MTGEHTSVIYGIHYPNRLFVGCLPPEAGAEDLGEFFSEYGNVVEAKVVLDGDGRSKRFGFVTFSNSDNVAELIKNRAIEFQGKMINVGPAVKKNLESETRNTKSQSSKIIKPAPGICAPQHTPKTIIRRSPTEQQTAHPQILRGGSGNHTRQRNENSFRSLWGISTRVNSVWTPAYGHKSSDSSYHANDRPFSHENSLNYSNISSTSDSFGSLNISSTTNDYSHHQQNALHQQNAIHKPSHRIHEPRPVIPPPGMCFNGFSAYNK